jgi:hypothetical protein
MKKKDKERKVCERCDVCDVWKKINKIKHEKAILCLTKIIKRD